MSEKKNTSGEKSAGDAVIEEIDVSAESRRRELRRFDETVDGHGETAETAGQEHIADGPVQQTVQIVAPDHYERQQRIRKHEKRVQHSAGQVNAEGEVSELRRVHSQPTALDSCLSAATHCAHRHRRRPPHVCSIMRAAGRQLWRQTTDRPRLELVRRSMQRVDHRRLFPKASSLAPPRRRNISHQ